MAELALGLLGEVTGVCGEPSRLKVVSGGKNDVRESAPDGFVLPLPPPPSPPP